MLSLDEPTVGLDPASATSCSTGSGYVIKGKLTFKTADGEETFETGDAYYVPPGHTPVLYAGPEVVRIAARCRLAGLHHPSRVAGRVAEAGVDAVRLLRRLLLELDAPVLELFVGALDVVGREEEARRRRPSPSTP